MCKKIHRGGNAEQYHADKKYKEAVAVAVAKCADDTKGQTCFICTQALHWKTKEGLVRGCACRGTAGFAHVSCLAEQAKILYTEAEENNLGVKVLNERARRWYECSLCEQWYHGAVACALSWASWKTYVGRPENSQVRSLAMGLLGNGLHTAGHHEDALVVKEAELSMMRRVGASQDQILVTQGNLASAYHMLGRLEEAVRVWEDVYSGEVILHGAEHEQPLTSANNYANSLLHLKRFGEAKALLRKTIPVARRVLGENHDVTLKMRKVYAKALCLDDGATLEDLREAVTTLEEMDRISRRVLGGAHPLVVDTERALQAARAVLHTNEMQGS